MQVNNTRLTPTAWTAPSRAPSAGSPDGLAGSVSPENATMDQLRKFAQSNAAEIDRTLETAAKNVPEHVRTGGEAVQFDEKIKEQITLYQQRKAAAEGTGQISRLVHREQLHGGEAKIHWNPAMVSKLNLFGPGPSDAMVRISDASAAENPDGKTMYGFALELKGQNGEATDILMTGGTPRTEASQAKNAEAQLALFNMLNPESKLKGIGRILWEVGVISGPRMLIDVARMRTSLDSLTELTAWSRAPFAVTGKDGQEYLVKMRVTPQTPAEDIPVKEGETTSQHLERGMAEQLKHGDVRWNLDFQFMQPGDNAEDARKTWNGPWVTAGEIVLPQTTDETRAHEQAAAAEKINYNPWKNKTADSTSVEKDVLRPWGELNRARLMAYNTSAGNRA